MSTFRKITTTLSIFAALALPLSASAETGSIEGLALQSQHETAVNIPSDTRHVLFAHDMSSKNLVQDMLSSKPADFLDEHKSVFVADISGMPTMIARMFAYPSLRKLPYTVILDNEGDQTAEWQRRDSAVTLISVSNYQITEQRFIDKVEDLLAAITTEPATEAVAPE